MEEGKSREEGEGRKVNMQGNEWKEKGRNASQREG